MSIRSSDGLRDEMARLMRDHIESLKNETFGGLNEEGRRHQHEQLEHIRDVSADFLAALKRDAA